MPCVFHSSLPEDLRNLRPLPGVQPLDLADWLMVDEVYAEQMAERERLIEQMPELVRARVAGSSPAVSEAFEVIVQKLTQERGFERRDDMMICPDGRRVSLTDDPLEVLGRLIQQDVCIMEKPDGAEEHVLTAAILCFPSHWTLAEKIGRPMVRIHKPVDIYDDNIAKRVQRLFDGVRVGRPLWRFNRAHAGPELFKPRSETESDQMRNEVVAGILRAERQCLVRLPKTRAVIFSIHTYVVQTGQPA